MALRKDLVNRLVSWLDPSIPYPMSVVLMLVQLQNWEIQMTSYLQDG